MIHSMTRLASVFEAANLPVLSDAATGPPGSGGTSSGSGSALTFVPSMPSAAGCRQSGAVLAEAWAEVAGREPGIMC